MSNKMMPPNNSKSNHKVRQVVIGEAYDKRLREKLQKLEDINYNHEEDVDDPEEIEVSALFKQELTESEEDLVEDLVDPETGELGKRKSLEKPRKDCPQCQKSFSSAYMLKEHIKVAHDNVKDIFCEHCDYKTARRSCLLLHMRKIHDKWKPYKCSEEGCKYTAYHLYQVNAHINLVHKNIRPYVCDYDNCSYSSASQSGLNLHVKRVHKKVKSLECQHCNYKTDKNYLLTDHVNAKHTNIKPYQCASCDFAAASKGVVTNHFKRVHLGLKREVKLIHSCPHCSYTSHNKHHLQDHVNQVHLNLKQFRCGLCSFECASKGSMSRHVMIHTGKKNFACPHCDYKSTRRVHLNEHIANVHVKSFNHGCKRCPYKTSSRQRLLKHMRIQHKEGKKNREEGILTETVIVTSHGEDNEVLPSTSENPLTVITLKTDETLIAESNFSFISPSASANNITVPSSTETSEGGKIILQALPTPITVEVRKIGQEGT